MTATATSRQVETSETPLTLLFPDLDGELKTTRRILERVPDGKDDWRPHEKSMTLGTLATHLAQLPGFGIAMLTSDEFDVANRSPQANPANAEDRLACRSPAATAPRRMSPCGSSLPLLV